MKITSLLFTIFCFAGLYAFTLLPIESDPEENFSKFCSGCHGSKVKTFVDRKWKYGNDEASIANSMKTGYADGGMPSFKATFSEDEITAMAAYIKSSIKERETYNFSKEFDDTKILEEGGMKYKLEKISTAAEIPWGMTFLPEGKMLITDKKGDLYLREKNGDEIKISNVPPVISRGQGGLLDVEIHPDFEDNQVIYLAYSKKNPDGEGQTTAILKAKLVGNTLDESSDIFVANPYLTTRHHYGSRMEFGLDGKLYFSVGDRGRRDDNPQSLENACGKIHRINDDGSIPSDNPFVNTKKALPSIWSYGHRNPQGLTFDNNTGTLWSNEHGPRGGDEINIVRKGKNYGWPVISYGINYNGTTFTNKVKNEGMIQPIHYWTPSLGVCGMVYVDSDRYPNWKGHLLSGSLRFEYLNISFLDKGKVKNEERLLKKIGRLRSVEISPDGFIYVGVEDPGRVYKLIPVD